jgi:hypothetical protein
MGIFDSIIGGLFGGGSERAQAASIMAASDTASWISALALPAIQAAAIISIEKYREGKIEDRINKRIKIADAATKEFCRCLVEDVMPLIKRASDDVPQPAIFQPVQPHGELVNNITSNHEILKCYGKEYAETMNEYIQEFHIARAVALNPKYYEDLELTSCSISDLLQGKMSTGKLLNISTDASTNAILNGKIGLNDKATRRMFGIEKENLMAQGRAERRAELQSQQLIYPVTSIQGFESMLAEPQFLLGFALQQAQLIQNSDQNEYNAYSRKEPYLQQTTQVMLQKCMTMLANEFSKAGMVDTHVPNYNALLNNQIQDITQGLFGNNTERASTNNFSDSSSSSNVFGGDK